MRWLHRHWRALAFALAAGCFVFAVALNRAAIDQIQDERRDRIAQQTEINCSLSTLVQASLESGSFGAEVDPDDLTQFQQAVVAAIAQVQLLLQQEAGATEQLAIFRRELRQLRRRTNCAAENARDQRAVERQQAIRDAAERPLERPR
jgi:hypothetical protein